MSGGLAVTGRRGARGITRSAQALARKNGDTVTQNRRAYARGQGDFADLARAGEGVMKPLPNSGTAPRQSRPAWHLKAAI